MLLSLSGRYLGCLFTGMALQARSKEFTCFVNPSSNPVLTILASIVLCLVAPLSGIHNSLENIVLNELPVYKSHGTEGPQYVILQNI